MKLVIDISKEMYKRFARAPRTATFEECVNDRKMFVTAIKNGIPLPKGHGRIADIDEVLEDMRATRTYDILFALERVKPIIEADEGEENTETDEK